VNSNKNNPNYNDSYIDKKIIESFAKKIGNYSKSLSSREQEILCSIILSVKHSLPTTNSLLSIKTKSLFLPLEMDLINNLVKKYNNK
jgi:hypothetical protein